MVCWRRAYRFGAIAASLLSASIASAQDTQPPPAAEGAVPPASRPTAEPTPAAPSPQGAAPTPQATEAVAADVADTELSRREAELVRLEQPPIDGDKERDAPDYDGRGDEPVTAGDVFIWIPRAVFSPVYLVTEYLIRWPVGKLTAWLDVNDIPDLVSDFFTFGPGGKSGLVPSGLIDFGFRPSIGLYFFSNDTLWNGSAVRTHLAFGGVDWYRATATLRHQISQESAKRHASMVQIKGTYSHRPDWKFFGVGANTFSDEEARFTAQLIDGELSYDGGFWRSSHIRLDAGVRDAQFKDKACCGDLSVGEAVAMGFYQTPTLFDDGYLVLYSGLNGILDSRERPNAYEGAGSDFVTPSATGIKLGARATFVSGLRDSPVPGQADGEPIGYAKYGGTLGAFVDIYNQRTLGLQLIIDFVDPLSDDGQIPFFDLVSLGGSRPMRGFLERRLLGRSSAVAELEYSWPIWVWLDGSLNYSLGNVFGERLKDFDTALLRQSFGLGFRANSARDHTFEFLLAFGTETFDQGGKLDSVRFVFGSTAGF